MCESGNDRHISEASSNPARWEHCTKAAGHDKSDPEEVAFVVDTVRPDYFRCAPLSASAERKVASFFESS